MRILVIGGTGLISSALVQQLVTRGHRVAVYNRGVTAGALSESVERLTGDRHDLVTFRNDMAAAGTFDCVYDMITFDRPQAEALIETIAGKTAQLIVCSTVDVYQKPARSYPIDENSPLIGLGSYARGKVEMEQALAGASVPVTIMRPCHVYGPGGSQRGHLIHSLGKGTYVLDRIRKGLPVVVHGDGTSLWSACFAEDAGEAFALAAGNAKVFGKALHIAPNEWITWRDYHEKTAQGLGAPVPSFVCVPTDELMSRAPELAVISAEHLQYNTIFDNSAALEHLGFSAKTPFLDGVRATVQWIEKEHGFEDAESNRTYNEISVRR